jgi:hypothetical protein
MKRNYMAEGLMYVRVSSIKVVKRHEQLGSAYGASAVAATSIQ